MEPAAPTPPEPTRRDFLKQAAMVSSIAMAAVGCAATRPEASAAAAPASAPAAGPWYRKVTRWGQTNITETDAINYDIPWWRSYWKRTQVGGVIVNAGGIFAYYPSKFPLHYRPPQLGDRDLFGELATAAQGDGLAVVARMDSSKVHEAMYRAHPDWIAVNADGAPYRSGELYLTCINTPYYSEFLPDVMREIIERSRPEGFADNIWSGLDKTDICHCQYCAKKFHDVSGKDLPRRRNYSDAVYRQWMEWNYTVRTAQWEFNNRVTQAAGGSDCLWIGMNAAGVAGITSGFRDMKELCARAEMILLDNQSRSDATGFQENAQAGKFVHSLLGHQKLAPESMAMYQHGRPQFRMSAKSPNEVRMWMLAGFAGGIQPWWHHVGAHDEDRRVYETAEPVMRWHRDNEQYLINRTPVATVALGWSRHNADYYGRDNAEELVALPWRGMTQALIRARIPHVPLHLASLDTAAGISVLILPNVGGISDAQAAAVRRFVQRGGALVATGQTSLFTEVGDVRPDFALADLFGVKGGRAVSSPLQPLHTYLRLPAGDRHAVLAGFKETDILPYGGTLAPLTVDAGAQVPLTYIPPFPSTPPETVWMRVPRTEIPGMILNESHGGRVVYIPADIDRRYATDNLSDHGDLLANAVRWAAGESIPLRITGPGLVNAELYSQGNRRILHLVNLTSAGTWRAPVEDLIPIGPLEIKVQLTDGAASPTASPRVTALVGGKIAPAAIVQGGWASFTIPSMLDHEVIVIEA